MSNEVVWLKVEFRHANSYHHSSKLEEAYPGILSNATIELNPTRNARQPWYVAMRLFRLKDITKSSIKSYTTTSDACSSLC
jgi:hypothetical protein